MEEYESMSNIEASTCRERSQNSKHAGMVSGVVAVAGYEGDCGVATVEAQQRRTFQHVSLFPQSQVSLSYCMQTRLELAY